MFVNTYTIDNVIQNKVTFETKQLNNLSQIEHIIKSLDGATTTTVTFKHNSNSYLCICGANNNFVLYTLGDEGMLMPAVIPEDDNNLFPDQVIINVSGCLSKFSKDVVLDLETTVNIAEFYVESEELIVILEDKYIKWMNIYELGARWSKY